MGKLKNQNDPFSEHRNLLLNLEGFKKETAELYKFIVENDAKNQGYEYCLDENFLNTQAFQTFLTTQIESEVTNIKNSIDTLFISIINPRTRISFIENVFIQIANLIEEFEDFENSGDSLEIVTYNFLVTLKNELHLKYDDELNIIKIHHLKQIKSAKLKFNTSRVELVQLFLLLKDTGIIDCKSDYALSLFIENNLMYFNSQTKEYSDLTKIKKYISAIRNQGLYSEPVEKEIKHRIAAAKIKINLK